jgi:xanthosine utilization system XapX-like protein
MRQAGVAGIMMRYSKIALLIFGAGLVVGFFVSALEVAALERPTALLIVGGIVLFPIGAAADLWRAITRSRPAKPKRRGKKAPARRAAQPRRRTQKHR